MIQHGLAVPPGRAGRLWLQRRLETARRGADLLDRKLRILQGEVARLRESTAETSGAWEQEQADAEQWLLRAGLLNGQRAIRLSADRAPAEVRISYAVMMGVRFPSDVTVGLPPAAVIWESSVLTEARQAHRAALVAAVHHAVAAEALRVMEAEALVTRYRLSAVRDRWIPRLERALAEVTLAIEEQERTDAARLRLAIGTPGSGGDARRPG